jgi:hypothetical protein
MNDRWPARPDWLDALMVFIWALILWAVIAGLDMVGGTW